MIYGFAYLGMVLAISAGWVVIAVLKKPDFIEISTSKLPMRSSLKQDLKYFYY